MLNNEDIKRLYKRETGSEWGGYMNPNKPTTPYYTDEFVEWLMENMCIYVNDKDE